jgi:hypothetical protein
MHLKLMCLPLVLDYHIPADTPSPLLLQEEEEKKLNKGDKKEE